MEVPWVCRASGPAPPGSRQAAPGLGPFSADQRAVRKRGGPEASAALAFSLKQQGVTNVVIPFSSLAVFLLIVALLGLAAATWPARRAAKLDALAAIAAD